MLTQNQRTNFQPLNFDDSPKFAPKLHIAPSFTLENTENHPSFNQAQNDHEILEQN